VLRGAFIGFGNVAAQGHLPGWQSRNDVAIVAAADVLSSRRDAFLKACPEARWYESLDRLLSNEPLDFVDICSPPSSHAGLIKQALEADLHVLCEKPLVTRPEDAHLVAAVSARAGRVVYTVHNWLKAPICIKISALIDERIIGSIRSIRWRTVRTQPAVTSGTVNWRLDPSLAGGGILFDHGWHALYCIVRWAGVPRTIAAVLENRRFRQSTFDDTATLNLDLVSGRGEIYLTWAGEERSNCIEIEGEQGQIHAANDSVVLRTNQDEQYWLCPPSLSHGSYHRDWFICVAKDFQIAVSDRTKSNLEDAVLCSRLIELAQRSSATGGIRLSIAG
jgi:predicted dehydrogenase